MEYWNNPIIELRWPNDRDPVAESLHNGAHCLFWNPQTPLDNIQTNQRLQDLCDWATRWLETDGPRAFAADPRNHYDLANLVKLNMWILDIRRQGIVKPWLMLDQGNGTYLAGNGDSRLRCLERIPEITSVAAFVSTTSQRADLYSGLLPVTSFDQFASLCGAEPGQEFLFRLTDDAAPYGMYWYEYNSERTRPVTLGQDAAVKTVLNYFLATGVTKITPEWFDQDIDWRMYE